MNYKVNDRKGQSLDIRIDGESIFVDGEKIDLDTVKISPDKYHIIHNDTSHYIELLEVDNSTKTYTVKINNQVIELSLEDALDIQLDKMGMSKYSTDKIDKVLAPMPGLVLKILAKEGQSVQKGDSLIVLEAMKMENIIKSVGEGVVKKIVVKAKDAVDKNQVLIEME